VRSLCISKKIYCPREKKFLAFLSSVFFPVICSYLSCVYPSSFKLSFRKSLAIAKFKHTLKVDEKMGLEHG